MGSGYGTGMAGCSGGNLQFAFVYIEEFGFYTLFGACQSKEDHYEGTKDKGRYFQEHNLH